MRWGCFVDVIAVGCGGSKNAENEKKTKKTIFFWQLYAVIKKKVRYLHLQKIEASI